MKYTIIRSDELTHHGILGQKWGVRRFQNPDGTLTTKGKQRLNTIKERSMAKYKRRSDRAKFEAERAQDDIKQLKKYGAQSDRAKRLWEMTSEEEKYNLAVRGGYSGSMGQLGDALFGTLAFQNERAMKQLIKEDIEDLEQSHAWHIKQAEKFTQKYKNVSTKDIDQLAVDYGFKEARRQLRTGK